MFSLRLLEIYGNRLIPTPIHTIKLIGKVNSKGPSQDILNTLSDIN
jgi:hypothetical protein